MAATAAGGRIHKDTVGGSPMSVLGIITHRICEDLVGGSPLFVVGCVTHIVAVGEGEGSARETRSKKRMNCNILGVVQKNWITNSRLAVKWIRRKGQKA
jgi:hypothetical protein